MAIQRQFCSVHPERLAIGVCVITEQAICAECSTRYEGVNYSREGLRILRERRAAAAAKHGRGVGWIALATVMFPAMLYALYLSYLLLFEWLLDLGQMEF